jgi:putative membrane-bound dehydrogenase-like protein
MRSMKLAWIFPVLVLLSLNAAQPDASVPSDGSGRALNLGFEDGSLRDWSASGNAFDKQPVKGDTVAARRNDMQSGHQGNYWIGTFENGGDALTGVLTSTPFKVTQPWASFWVAGGAGPGTRVELVRADSRQVVFKSSGYDNERLRPVIADLQSHLGREIFIRVVDEEKGPWGHINFDEFKFHAAKPQFAAALDPATIARRNEMPPADQYQFAGLSPEDAAKKMTLPPGFSAKLFAGEPDIKQPIAFALDDRGRIWVAEAYTYPVRAPEGQGKDRILVFEDTNGDGKFDRRTVFVEGLNLVSGLEVGFGGVWVGAAPHLMFIPIKDGDAPKPAGEPVVLLDGWDFQRDTHETLNTFTWGPDGWLYGCHGVFCPSFVGKPGTPKDQRQRVDAGVWRFHPTKHVFEVFAEGTSNPWGVDFDEHGQCIIEACVIPHLWHMIQGARYERQGGQHYNINHDEQRDHEKFATGGAANFVNPFIFEDIKTIADHVHYAGNKGPHAGNGRSDQMGGGHAHAGLMVYQGDSWPEQFRGKVFMNNIHGARINEDSLERQGSGFAGHHQPDFILFNDSWSQILNFQTDQNGSVYLIDWYDKNQCHHNRVDGHDRTNGRIFKIVYGNQKWTPIDLQKLSDAELVKLQTHRNEFQVRHARRILQERAARDGLSLGVQVALAKILSEDANENHKLRALWTLHTVGGLTDPLLLGALKSPGEYVRAWAVQLAMESRRPVPSVILALTQMAKDDPSPVVRLYLASALQRFPLANSWEMFTSLAAHVEDAGDHNIPLMLWYGFEPLIGDDFQRALNLAQNIQFPRLLNFAVRRVAANATPESYSAIVSMLKSLPDEKRQIETLNGLATALKGQRTVAMPKGWEEVETRLSASNNSEIRAQAQALALTFGSTAALQSLKKTLMDAAAELSTRRMAMESLLGVRDAGLPGLLQELLPDPSLRAAALRGLAAFDDSRSPAKILSVYNGLSAPEKRDALNTLVARASFARPLLAAVEQGALPRKDLSADLIRQLRNLKNPELDQEIQKVWGIARTSSAEKKQLIEKYKRVYQAGGSQPGDAARGRAVFAKACQQCHTLFDTGGAVGPDLTGSNRADLDYILENIVDPNAVIPNEFRSSTIEMKDDRVVMGIVKEQDAKKVTVQTANELLTLPRTDIRSLQQNELSMMPEGLIDPLNDQEIRDLIYYLSRPGQVPLPSETRPAR